MASQITGTKKAGVVKSSYPDPFSQVEDVTPVNEDEQEEDECNECK